MLLPHRNPALTPSSLMKFAVLAGLACAIAMTSAASAQTPASWPPKLVKIIVPYAPGSTPDLVGRMLADDLQARHPGSSFVVETKTGAGGNIGTDAVAKAEPNGATIGISLGGPLAINTLLFSKLPYDPDKGHRPDHAANLAAECAGGTDQSRHQFSG